ncbi:MAG TPA: hypothetical protein VH374_26330 [Polyangia bacterium]|jgi:hypothetical protein|nr:hypothetical protein [Polyangia bacterium]
MARATLAIPPDDVPDDTPDDPPTPVGAEALDDEARIREYLAKLPPDTRTKLYRVDDFTKRWVIHGVLAPHEVTMEYVARMFGGGTYQVVVMRKSKEGGEISGSKARWLIPGRYKGVHDGLPGIDQPSAPADDPLPSAPSDDRPPNTREWLDGILASRAIDVLKGGNRGSDMAGMAAVITAVAAAVTPLLAPVVAKLADGGKGDALRDELADLKAELRALRNAPGPAQSALGDALKGVREIAELRELFGERGGGKESLVDKLLAAAPGVLDAMTQRNAPAAPPLAGPPMTPGISVEVAPGAPLETTAPMTPAPKGPTQWHDLLRLYRDQLLHMANMRWEPDFCADMVVRVMPPEQQGLLAEFVQRDDAQTIATEAVPELATFATWTPAFLSELRARVDEHTDEDDEK